MTVDDIVISGHNFESSDALNEIIHKKFKRLLNHYGHFITDIEVILKIDNEHRNIAESNVHVPEKQINASASTDDMYKSVDEMIHKLEVQLEKYKEIHFGHKKEQRIEQQIKNAEDAAERAALAEE